MRFTRYHALLAALSAVFVAGCAAGTSSMSPVVTQAHRTALSAPSSDPLVFAVDFSTIHIYDLRTLRHVGDVQEGQGFSPLYMAGDSKGTLYVADSGADQIEVYAPYQWSRPTRTVAYNGEAPGPMHVDRAGNLWAFWWNQQNGDSQIVKMAPGSSNPVRKIDVTGFSPSSIDTDSYGNLWEVGININDRKPIVGYWPPRSDTFVQVKYKLWYPVSLAFDSSGNLWIQDSATAYLRRNVILEYPPGKKTPINIVRLGPDTDWFNSFVFGADHKKLFVPNVNQNITRTHDAQTGKREQRSFSGGFAVAVSPASLP